MSASLRATSDAQIRLRSDSSATISTTTGRSACTAPGISLDCFPTEASICSAEPTTRSRSGASDAGSFVSRLLRAVKAVEGKGYKYVLYLQEDMWLTEPVDAELLAGLVSLMEDSRLDCLKLGTQPFPEDHEDIRRTSGPVSRSQLGSTFRWFGSHRFTFSHHTSIFRCRFLIEMSYAARLFGRRRPLQQERFCSGYLKDRTVANEGDGKRYRIGVFADEPLVRYVHASESGKLTEEARSILTGHGIADHYDPTLEGEVFPEGFRQGI